LPGNLILLQRFAMGGMGETVPERQRAGGKHGFAAHMRRIGPTAPGGRIASIFFQGCCSTLLFEKWRSSYGNGTA
jgi:hypothetical protein